MKKIHTLLYNVLPLLLILTAHSCVSEELTPPSPNPVEAKKDVFITVNIPGTHIPTTRSMDGAPESHIATVDLLVFDYASSGGGSTITETFREYVQGDVVSITNPSGGSTEYTAQFKAKLSAATDVRIAIVANARTQIAHLFDGNTVNGEVFPAEAKDQVLAKLQYILSNTSGTPDGWKWVAGTTANTPIPMYGEMAAIVDIAAGKKFTDAIDLHRALARIDVKNNVVATKFQLNKIHLVNYNTRGQISPAGDSTLPNLPGSGSDTDTGKQKGAAHAMEYAHADASPITAYLGEIYTFEAAAATDGTTNNASSRMDATCLVLEGYYNNDKSTPYFYRVDFTYERDAADTETQYMPLLRNYKYEININEASGIGYTTLGGAIESYTVQSNLKTQIIHYDLGAIHDVVYNGQYMLGVSNEATTITKEKQDFSIKAFTNTPGGWKAEIAAHVGSWLTFTHGNTQETGTSGDDNAFLHLSTTGFTGTGNRTATINLTADRLSMTLTVTQTDQAKYYLRFTDEEGNEIDELQFLSTSANQSIGAQKFYVSWNTGSDATINSVTGDFQYAGTDPFASGSISGGIYEYTIQPVIIPVGSSDNPATYLASIPFYATDPFGNQITNSIQLVHQYIDLSQQITSTLNYPYIGAFWKHDQWGERLIRMTIPQGDWTASVIVGDEWIRLDTNASTDGNLWQTGVEPDDMMVNDAAHRLNSSASTSINGTTSAGNNNLYFRIGLTGPHPEGANAGINGTEAPRYGVVVITHRNGVHPIFIRQGEASSEVVSGSGIRFSPYNLTDLQGRGAGDASGVYMPDGADFTEYPSQGGYLFQFQNKIAYYPVGDFTSGTWTTATGVGSPCPAGWGTPNGGAVKDFVSGLTGNTLWGYYADGWFDRREIGDDGGGARTKSAVSRGSTIAYNGRLFHSGTSSLFTPAASSRRSNAHGALDTSRGGLALYMTNYATPYETYMYISHSRVTLDYTYSNSVNRAISVRCVKQ